MADITRAEVASLISEEYAGQVIQAATQGSTVLNAFPTINMGTKVTHMSVLAGLPTAGWVTDVDNTGVKTTSDVIWNDQTMVAEEIAVIIPIHENTVDDANVDILAQISALAGQAIGKALDLAVIFGTQKPASWTSPALVPAATASGNVINAATAAGPNDIYGAGLQVAGLLADKGFDATVALARRGLQFQFANLRDANGAPILQGDQLAGFDTYWNRNGAWDPAAATQVIADPSVVRIGVRQDIQVKYLDQATVGGHNLAEKDMVALRFKARFAYVLGNMATPEAGTAAGYGVGVVAPPVVTP